MKKLLLILSVLALPVICSAGGIQQKMLGVLAVKNSSTVCATPQTGDELSEGFIASGYENTWAETIGSGGTVDEDHTLTGTPPAAACTEGLLTSAPTSSTSTYAQWNRGSVIADGTATDITIVFRVNSYTLPASLDVVRILQWGDSSNANAGVFDLRLFNNSGTFQLRPYGSNNVAVAISTETWYTVVIHLDATAASSYFTVNGGSNNAFTRNAADGQYLRIGAVYALDADEAAEIEWGGVWINTP